MKPSWLAGNSPKAVVGGPAMAGPLRYGCTAFSAEYTERQTQSTVKTLNLLYSQYTLTELLIAIVDAQSIANAYYYGVTYSGDWT